MHMSFDWYQAAQAAEFMYPESLQTSRFRFYAVQQVAIESQGPAVRVLCDEGQNLGLGSRTVRFPQLPQCDVAINRNYTVIHYHEVEISGLGITDPSDAPRLTWVDLRAALPVNEAESVSYGLTYESPWQLNNSRTVSGCTIDARWASASVWSRFPGPFQATFLQTREPTGGFRRTSFLPSKGPSWRRMLFDPRWLDAINFIVPESAPGHNPSGITALEALSTSAGVDHNLNNGSAANRVSTSIEYLEYVIASALSDALSRIGSYRSYNTSGTVDDWAFLYYNASPDANDIMAWNRAVKPLGYDLEPRKYMRMKMRVSVTGYGYQSSTSSDYLALLVLFLHLLLALMHTIYNLSTRQTSGCWDTFSELMALAQQSQPARSELSNTCAGISKLGTFKHRVGVKVAEKNGQHLELVFGEEDQLQDRDHIDLEMEYGGV